MKKFLVFDIETQDIFGPDRKTDGMKVSLVGVYSYFDDRYYAFLEHDMDALGELFKDAECLIGFNSKSFDVPILQQYIHYDLSRIPHIDIFEDVTNHLGHRVSLNILALSTLGEGKTGDGLKAIDYYRDKKFEELKKYCLDDVRLTKDIFDYGRRHDKVVVRSKDSRGYHDIPVNWSAQLADKNIRSILEEAYNSKKQVALNYLSFLPGLENPRVDRNVEINKLDDLTFSGFCHLRKSDRVFQIKRVFDAVVTNKPYEVVKNQEVRTLGI